MEDTKPKKFVFVLMPFHTDFDDVYNFGIKQTCTEIGAYCERVDEQIFIESILDRILNQISKADILIADMSGRNPNVFYEVGYSHGIGKKVILLTQNADDIPFDFKHFPHIVYGNSIKELNSQLRKKLEFFLVEPDKESVDFLYNFNLEIYFDGKRIEKNAEVIFDPETVYKYNYEPRFDIYNNSDRMFKNKISIGLESNSELEEFIYHLQVIKLPNNRSLFLSKDVSTFYPKGWKNISFTINNSSIPREGLSFDTMFKIFAPHETIDIPIKLMFRGYRFDNSNGW